jgi:hypothetical protein
MPSKTSNTKPIQNKSPKKTKRQIFHKAPTIIGRQIVKERLLEKQHRCASAKRRHFRGKLKDVNH